MRKTKTRNGYTVQIPGFDSTNQGPILIRKLEQTKPTILNVGGSSHKQGMTHSSDLNSHLNFNAAGTASQLVKQAIGSTYDSQGASQQNFFHAGRKIQKTEHSPYQQKLGQELPKTMSTNVARLPRKTNSLHR